MASYGPGQWSDLDAPSWRLQTKTRVGTAQSSLCAGGFAAWTDVPPVGIPDPQLADQNRAGKLHFPTLPGYAPEADPMAGGKRIVPERIPRDRPEGKRVFHTTGGLSTSAPRPGGLKRVHPPGPPSTADPNSACGAMRPPKPEGVKITPGGRNDVKYQCWRPEQLMNAYGGDWNLNTRYGLRKLGLMDNGVPKRMMETPIAWPSYAGYPPDRDANGKLIDYGLKQNGGILSLKPQKHPDMVRSHQNRLAAGIPPKSYTSFRHAGERHY